MTALERKHAAGNARPLVMGRLKSAQAEAGLKPAPLHDPVDLTALLVRIAGELEIEGIEPA